ncbi:MAG: hypothetical protein J5I35_11065 [Methanothrix harundinacea]|nr:hypothetical protein [Methanothrix harundinacea]
MAKFQVEGAIFDTERAGAKWPEAADWNGSNHISRNSGTQWGHEALYISQKGRYYVVRSSDYQGSQDEMEILSPREAAGWLVLNDHPLPEDLAGLESEVVE